MPSPHWRHDMAPNSSRERVFRALHDIAVAVGGVLEPVALGRLVVHQARELLDASAVGLYLFDEATQVLEPIYSSDAREVTPEPSIPLGAGAAGQALLLGEPVVVDDYTNWPHAGTWASANGVQSAMAVPLMVADRRTGAISVRSYAARHWTEDDVQTLTLLAAQIAPVLDAAQLYERTRDARLMAEDAIKLRDEVLAGVSHDLAGPLARIRLYAELIQGDAPNLQPSASAEQMHLWSERIVAATVTMKSIMQELVDVARLQMGHALQLDLRRTDLVSLSRRLVAEHLAAGRLVSVGSSCDEIVGWWDEARLSRVLSNLLDNAFNYSPLGSGVNVLVEAMHGNGTDTVLLRVRDYGLGIPSEDLPHVFERFYRGSNVSDATTGSGLGLAVARQIVEQHGGSIEVESQLGQGTVMSLRLPRTTPPALQ
jgi:signal transduction histidine kinase